MVAGAGGFCPCSNATENRVNRAAWGAVRIVALIVPEFARQEPSRADLKRRGQLIGTNDLFIAAHARSLGVTLVANNTAGSERVKHLAIANWTRASRRKP